MKKDWKSFFLILLIGVVALLLIGEVTSSYSEFEFSSMIKQDVNEQKLFSFVDGRNTISLKTTGAGFNGYNQPRVNLSYIVEVPSSWIPKKDNEVYLRLIDKLGFEVEKIKIKGYSEKYTGPFKGNIMLNPSEYERISGAEVCETSH